LAIPATLENNTYTWAVQNCGLSQDRPIGQISIAAPHHTFTAPPVDVEIDTRLGDVATLVGVALAPHPSPLAPATTLTVTLTWRAENTPPDSYHVFLHLLDTEGRLAAQSDGIPATWSRPTTGWLPGEYITDVHALTIPPDAPAGDYILSTGLYIPNGERLTAPDGTDAIPLTTISVTDQ
jgi:hypothetical protein